jgi:hypothetical protein
MDKQGRQVQRAKQDQLVPREKQASVSLVPRVNAVQRDPQAMELLVQRDPQVLLELRVHRDQRD